MELSIGEVLNLISRDMCGIQGLKACYLEILKSAATCHRLDNPIPWQHGVRKTPSEVEATDL